LPRHCRNRRPPAGLGGLSGEGPDGLPRTVSHFGDETIFQCHAKLEHDPDHISLCLTMTALRKHKTASFNRLTETPEGHFNSLAEQGVQAVLALRC